jgi:hypothetical protein
MKLDPNYKPKKTAEEELEEELSYVTEDSEYARLQDEIKAKRVKHQALIENMILKKDYILEYMERNRRALSLTSRDVQTFRTLLNHVTRV